jgi:hypothetical protein
VVSKIQARVLLIIEYLKVTIQEGPHRTEIALDSQQARILFAVSGGEPVSRKETIRAMRRAEVLWPALRCGHRPGDGRQTSTRHRQRSGKKRNIKFGKYAHGRSTSWRRR